MGYGFETSHRLETGLSLRIDPRVILSSQLLLLSSSDLNDAIETELNENPALDRLDTVEPVAQHEVLKAIAPAELKQTEDSWESRRSLPGETEDSWVDMAVAQSSLYDELLAGLLGRLKPEQHRLGEYLIGSLDDRGYLDTPVEEIALAQGISIEEVEAVLKHLHRCEPAGIGARNLIECLMLQLNQGTDLDALGKVILTKFLDELINRRPDRIAKRLKLDPEFVLEAFDRIHSLTPYPASGFRAHPAAVSSSSASVVPDLIIHHTEHGWSLEVAGFDPTNLIINHSYERRLNQTDRKREPSEHRHLTTYVHRAEEFIHCVHMRRETLKKIGWQLIASQGGFLATGDYSFLKPLTRCFLAKAIGMHESTVSRATSGKFVQLPSGEMVLFEIFFKPALRVQKMIEEILRTQPHSESFSDEKIAQLLKAKGIDVARRTVSKYRDRQRLLSSRSRRVA